MDKFSFLNNIDISQIEELYELFKKDSKSIDESWRMFFEGYEFSHANYSDHPHDEVFEKRV